MKEEKQSFPLLTCEQPNQYGEALYRNGVTLSSASYNVSYCLYYAGESSFEVKIEADTNDVTEHPCDDKPKKHLKQHKQTHTGDKFYSSTQCKKCFSILHYLRKHMNVHGSKYKCTECGKCFSNNVDLTAHRQSFCAATELKHHQLKHSDFKQFCCGSCGKYFKQKHDVVSHFNRCSVKLEYVYIFARQD